MNILDGVFFVIIILSLIRGLLRGLVREVTFIVALAVAFLGASKGYPPLQVQLQQIIPFAELAATIAYVLVFFGIFLLILFLGAALRHLLQGLMLGSLDRLGGGVLGMLKGALLCAVIILLLMTVFTRDAKVLRTSRLSPYMIRISGEMASYVPKHYKKRFREVALDLQEAWEDSDLSRWLDLEKEGES